MKKVAGRLRIDLAQFRELEAFAKFGSDLDKATLAQLRRGSALVELLKQGQYDPMPVEKQVVSLYAGTNGYLDEIPTEHIQRYEKELLELMDIKHSEVLRTIAEKKDLDADIIEQLKMILKAFTESFKASVTHPAAVAQ
jgi:F-type H+-transporting ATPase subunit alpha